MATTYTSIHLAKRPKDKIIPGETFSAKKNSTPKEADLQDGEVVFQILYLSLDPAMRGWLNGEFDSISSFSSQSLLHNDFNLAGCTPIDDHSELQPVYIAPASRRYCTFQVYSRMSCYGAEWHDRFGIDGLRAYCSYGRPVSRARRGT